MNSRHLLPGFVLLLVSALPAGAIAAHRPAAHARVHELGIAAGRWVYHGHFIGHNGTRMSAWTWHANCGWSANRAFMLCSYSNTWAGEHVDSVVVDTYNHQDHSFWHYEIFNSGHSPGKPFAARMRIDGLTHIESWTSTRKGRSIHQRIVYTFASADKVTVRFQQSAGGMHWRTTAIGIGEKVGP